MPLLLCDFVNALAKMIQMCPFRAITSLMLWYLLMEHGIIEVLNLLKGVGVVISVDTGEILNAEVVSKFM